MQKKCKVLFAFHNVVIGSESVGIGGMQCIKKTRKFTTSSSFRSIQEGSQYRHYALKKFENPQPLTGIHSNKVNCKIREGYTFNQVLSAHLLIKILTLSPFYNYHQHANMYTFYERYGCCFPNLELLFISMPEHNTFKDVSGARNGRVVYIPAKNYGSLKNNDIVIREHSLQFYKTESCYF